MVASMHLIGFLTALLLTCLPSAGETDDPLQIHLISEVRSISPGKPFFVGVHLVHPPGSHTYWQHPGIVGLATKIEWDLPPGFSAGEIQWPAPQVVEMAGYEAQGYQGETLLMIPITPPDNLSSATVTLTAKISWMCCGTTCHPAVRVPFSVTLPRAAVAESDPSTHPLFEKFRAAVPRPDPAWTSTVRREQDKIILTLKPPGAILKPTGIHFFSADGQVDSNQKQQVEILSGGVIRMTLARAETAPGDSSALPGVVCLPRGGMSFQLEINPAY